jgi:hypothetical protein
MSTGKLILHSGNDKPSISATEPLYHALKQIKLIGEAIDGDAAVFLTGEHFLQLISFVGCSTNVCLTPNSNDFCHITISGPFDQPTLIWDRNCRPPRCTACKETIANWQEQAGAGRLKCPLCNRESKLEELSWGRQAGYSFIFIQIHNIFPGEARPTHSLIETLSDTTNSKWSYFYTE